MPVNPDEVLPYTVEVLPQRAPGPDVDPEVEVRRRAWWNEVFGAVMLIGVSFLLVGTALTISRFSGPDYGEARRTGTAAIERCTVRGPISLKGFGYHDRCTVAVTWNVGSPSRVTIDKPGFFSSDERVGDIIQIGENQGGYSRPSLPERTWVYLLSWFIALLGLLPLVAAAVYLRQSFRTAIR